MLSSRYYCSTQWHTGVTLIEIAVPADQNILGRYQDLSLEIKRIVRATRVTVIPIAIGAFGTISGNAKARYGRLSLPGILNRGHVGKLLFIQHGFPFLFLLIFFDSKQFCFLLLQTAMKKFLVFQKLGMKLAKQKDVFRNSRPNNRQHRWFSKH